MANRMSETIAPRIIRPAVFVIVMLCIFIASFVNSCGGGSGAEQMQEQKFLDTYVELLIIREQYPDTSEANPRIKALMRQQGYSEESFKQHFAALARDAEHFRNTIDSARALARLIQRGQDAAPDTSAAGDN